MLGTNLRLIIPPLQSDSSGTEIPRSHNSKFFEWNLEMKFITLSNLDWLPDSVLPTKTTSWGYNYLYLLSFSEPFHTNHCLFFLKPTSPFWESQPPPAPCRRPGMYSCWHAHTCTTAQECGLFLHSNISSRFSISYFTPVLYILTTPYL